MRAPHSRCSRAAGFVVPSSGCLDSSVRCGELCISRLRFVLMTGRHRDSIEPNTAVLGAIPAYMVSAKERWELTVDGTSTAISALIAAVCHEVP